MIQEDFPLAIDWSARIPNTIEKLSKRVNQSRIIGTDFLITGDRSMTRDKVVLVPSCLNLFLNLYADRDEPPGG